MQSPRDTHLDELGHNRASFKHHVTLFLVVNALFWLIWAATGSGYAWPIWTTALGSVGVIFHYIQAWCE